MSQQKVEVTCDQLRQVCRNKDFNVATDSLASDQDQRQLGRVKEKVCRDNRPRKL